jgi:hypothetical protein
MAAGIYTSLNSLHETSSFMTAAAADPSIHLPIFSHGAVIDFVAHTQSAAHPIKALNWRSKKHTRNELR